jgi:hypothetical protein
MNYHDCFIGDPAAQMDNWILQDQADNCAVAAEASLINQFIGDDLSLENANYISASHGWWHPGMGTDPGEIGNLMDMYNIPNHTVMGANIHDLAVELQNGHGVIVGVNSSELWDKGLWNEIKQFFCDAFGLDTAEFNPADHAVVITGMDLSDPDHPKVIINDSGVPGGAAVPYPLDKFVDAWQNSGFYYTATDMPIPDSPFPSPNTLGFDLGEFLGLATTVLTGDPNLGQLVNAGAHLLTEADWESILEAV